MNYEIEIRSKDNVRNNGEVFTPSVIVDKMIDLIPDGVWADPEYYFLEPACGNGNFLVAIFNRRIDSGISTEITLRTMIGMDISQQNIDDCHARLLALAPGYIDILNHQVFLVDDSLSYIRSGKLQERFSLN